MAPYSSSDVIHVSRSSELNLLLKNEIFTVAAKSVTAQELKRKSRV